MKKLLQIILTCGCFFSNACSTTKHVMPAVSGPLDSVGRHAMVASSPLASQTAPSTGQGLSKHPPVLGDSASEDDASMQKEESAVAMNRFTVSTRELTSYALEYESARGILRLRDYRVAPWEDAGRSIIWAEAGYWDAQIVAIDGVDVSGLGRREWYRKLFNGADLVHLSVLARSRRIIVIDAFIGKGPKPSRVPGSD